MTAVKCAHYSRNKGVVLKIYRTDNVRAYFPIFSVTKCAMSALFFRSVSKLGHRYIYTCRRRQRKKNRWIDRPSVRARARITFAQAKIYPLNLYVCNGFAAFVSCDKDIFCVVGAQLFSSISHIVAPTKSLKI